MALYDKDACHRRNRLAARRDGVEAAPIRLMAGGEADELLKAGAGKMPRGLSATMAAINALRPGEEPLTETDVWIHYAEAANTNLCLDRYLFLHRSTLKNIAANAAEGRAFMNSHRTGGYWNNGDTELPFGKTFCGEYREDEGGARAFVGLYMLRGVQPNGGNGPSTDDLHKMIDGGTIADVSVGLQGGEPICDVDGLSLHDRDQNGEFLCPHVPGTDWQMKDAEKKSQKGRGVPNGYASYSLVDSRLGEISGVYDGAVPGAGFVKALSLSPRLDAGTRTMARAAYHNLVNTRDFREIVASALALDPVSGEYAPVTGTIGGAAAITTTTLDSLHVSGRSFEEQLEGALAALDGCIERAEQIHARRSIEGRTLAASRREQIAQVAERLAGLVALCRDPKETRRATRMQALRLRAEVTAMLAGGP